MPASGCAPKLTSQPDSEFGKPGFRFAALCGKTSTGCGWFCPMFDSMISSGPAGGAMLLTHPVTWAVTLAGAGINAFQIHLYTRRDRTPGDCDQLELFYLLGGAFGLFFIPLNLAFLMCFWRRPGALPVQILGIVVTLTLVFNLVWWILGNYWFWATASEEKCGVLYTKGKIAMIMLDCIPALAAPLGWFGLWKGNCMWPWGTSAPFAPPAAEEAGGGARGGGEPFGETRPVRRIGVCYFDGGTAHRTAAFAIRDVLQSREDMAGVEVTTVDAYVEIFREDDTFCRHVGAGMEAFNDALKYERVTWLGCWLGFARMMHDSTAMECTAGRMGQYFTEHPYDLFISTMPLYNELIFNSLRRVCPWALTVVLPVDFSEALPRYWFSPRAPTQHYIVFNDTLAQQAARRHPGARVHRIGGMVLPPGFYQDAPSPDARAAGKEELGLPPDRPVGLVSFGGQGSMLMVEIARLMDEVGRDFGMIYVCGRNEDARVAIEKLQTRHAKVVMGFTKEMPRLMRLSDFFIGKPGPTSIHEAIAAGAPAILFKSGGMKFLLGKNEVWFVKSGLGLVIKSVGGLVTAARHLFDELDAFRGRVAEAYHRGVFDFGDIVARDVIGAARLPPPPPPQKDDPAGAADAAGVPPLTGPAASAGGPREQPQLPEVSPSPEQPPHPCPASDTTGVSPQQHPAPLPPLPLPQAGPMEQASPSQPSQVPQAGGTPLSA